ncbi:class III lanthionine synthetase LanKC [Streptomyces sp. MBT62]|uniref:class III lanthionine synthetase LanKC n=1 Tax=Streptomyces sp. MBT62 TaxID=2800410 RepID=UPI00190A6E7B|nr:class III lanthionine synthetase LanKC [Streptomyces sp. MBT62]MBK3563057.1 class III lanthionine synthetase LanKC [Streptomyces sp. MBT62]
MINERWVYRFPFCWNDSLFFDPLDVSYKPHPDHFLASLDDRVRSRFVRKGIWWSYRHNANLPEQGWKIHVSANQRNVREVAASVIAYLTEHDIDFKIALDLTVFEMLSSKAISRGSGGKLVTVYPRDDDEFRSCLADLAEVLDGAEGPYVLSDLRYRDCKALYFRYGQFLDTHSVDVLGRPVPHITGPDGPVADDRRPGYAQPWWVAWPFTDWKPPADPDEDGLLAGRFRVTGALQFSNSGGVYTAEDTANDDRVVVLKEARPYTNVDPRQDHDAVDILNREWVFLNRLADVGSFPVPITTFRHWEHHFIAEEFVDGTDIRSMLLERNPLARLGPGGVAQSQEFLRIFLAVFRGLARALQSAHDRNVILGDFTAANVLIDPDTLQVTIVDLETCRLTETDPEHPHLEAPVELYTPGFSNFRRRFAETAVEDDQFGLAMTMAYFIFPVAALSYLREDILDRYRIFTDSLGWPSRIHELLTDLARARVTLTDVLRELEHEDDLVDQVRAVPVRPVVEERLGLAETEAGLAAFIDAVADTDRPTLFPVDPFAHVTNPLSLGFGASGVLWALNASGVPLRPEWLRRLRDDLADIDPAQYPAGLMNGLAGIAWATDTLGFPTQARQLLTQANRHAHESGDPTFYYGLAGVGMTNLRFHLRDRDAHHLAAARDCARALREAARHDGDRVHWLNEFTSEKPFTGLGFGQAGVAMFLLRMHQITGDDWCLDLGRGALAWEMAHAERHDDGNVTFDHYGTAEPYVEVGSAGVARVLLRYGDLDSARTVLRALDVRQAVLPGFSFGMSGIADTLLDAVSITGDTAYRNIAVRQLDFVRRLFLFEPDKRFGVAPHSEAVPLGSPGDGLLRCSTDYLTGSAGILRVLHRLNHGGTADFLLDEVSR